MMMMRRRRSPLEMIADRPEVTLPPRKRLSIVHCPGYEVEESSVAAAARPIKGRRADYEDTQGRQTEIF
uniref:Reverse transcriptase domain-containing protein n=1 Tax=Tanacetum cinerariifolium TaxID=118510 RepID=A0A699TD40_TANCI|nr:hypothetical protein [Tanacetum cinerariifolium]